ncbi:MAG: hypothetical protein AMJ73_00680 [candidate division Zixibacteria bacterium SM1_73]|nr:MAG: hypothetical protein AMJ73_00680 [candidate division Zixibacteria bacterium SM1_73]
MAIRRLECNSHPNRDYNPPESPFFKGGIKRLPLNPPFIKGGIKGGLKNGIMLFCNERLKG